MKLTFDAPHRSQPDPFIFEDGGRYYLYVTAGPGVEAYSADDVFGTWHYEGVVASIENGNAYWAPCIIKTAGKYWLYFSCDEPGTFEYLHVMSADRPLGPFGDPVRLFEYFSIDAHVVETEAGLFLWYALDNREAENGRIGTRVYVDRLLDPVTPERRPVEKIVPTMDEEIFMRNRFGDGRDWHTIEGPFWFREGEWQYVMYSGACFQNDTYHIGYAAAKSSEADLTKVTFEKHTKDGAFDPVMIKNEFEEGVGHHSVLKLNGQYYAVYHGRDLTAGEEDPADRRTARICRLTVKDGIITAERFSDRV